MLTDEHLHRTDNTAFMPEEEIQLAICKKLGERVLARKGCDFARWSEDESTNNLMSKDDWDEEVDDDDEGFEVDG